LNRAPISFLGDAFIEVGDDHLAVQSLALVEALVTFDLSVGEVVNHFSVRDVFLMETSGA